MTFDDIAEGAKRVARSVTITGTRSINQEAESRLGVLFPDYVRPFAEPEAKFFLGGAAGIDTFALHWLAEHTTATLTVVVPCTVADQPSIAGEAIARWNTRGRIAEIVELAAEKLATAAYHARNRWMVDRSDFVIGFPKGADQSSGTWYTLNYAADHAKPQLVVPL
jgi:hypothetical protein